MKKDDFEKLTNSMRDKLGEDNAGVILDDLGTLLADNVEMNNQLENKDKEIEKLQKDKEMLLETNGNLLKQVSVGFEKGKEIEMEKESEKEKIDIRTAFDSKGNFIK